MTGLLPFDPLHTPLEGTLLMEASAGTGKTHTIASLVVRLVLEQGLPVERILVVTFTEAASGELKERIYARLSDTLAALEGRGVKEAFSEDMARRHGASPQARARILAAIRNFDRAAIGTIHSFCYRMLRENRFESGLRFDAELATDAGLLRQNAADDVWRRDVASMDTERAALLVARLTPERLMELASRYGGPDALFFPDGPMPDLEMPLTELKTCEKAVQDLWREHRESLCPFLTGDSRLNRTVLRVATLEKGFGEMEAWTGGRRTCPPEILTKFSPEALKKATKKGFEPPEHPFFDACAALERADRNFSEARDLARALFLKDRIRAVHRQEAVLKEKAGLLTFDDLLLRLRDAVLADSQGGMCQRIRELFGAALIDEFQDTDPVQYAIFDAVFTQAGLPLLLIGDPKQAIYAFRGADVFAYLDAAKKSRKRYTLDRNWRSDPGLIDAVNRIFKNNPKAFVLEGLSFHPVQAAQKERDIFEDPENPLPFTFWLAASEDKKPLSAARIQAMGLAAVSDEIIRLLEGGRENRIRIGDRGVRPGDMAVLVRSNREALQSRDFLAARGIPAVIHADGNVLDSEEARELSLVLEAVLHPWDGGRVRRALVTELMGFTLRNLDTLNRDEPAFNAKTTFFTGCRALWQDRGIFRMLTTLYGEGSVLIRAASLPQGERRITNLLHLAEILHTAESQENRGPELLMRWLERQQDASLPRRVEAPLRLESDGERVRVITVHRSKGLEYPIVFCPFLYSATDVLSSRSNPEKIMAFHDPERAYRLCVDFGGREDRSREETLTRQEAMAEQVRLLYVALTRARHRVYGVWGMVSNARNRACGEAAAWLLHGPDRSAADAAQRVKDMAALASEGILGCLPLPEDRKKRLPPAPEEESPLVCCTVRPLPADPFRISSFSALVAGKYMDRAADRDGEVRSRQERQQETDPQKGIFAFPSGTRAGTFMHHVFEHLDFTQNSSHIEAVIEKSLAIYGYDRAWTPVLRDMVEKVLRLPMGPEGFRLRELTLKEQLRELDFYFPLNTLESDALSQWVKKITLGACDHLPPQLERLHFSRSAGYLRGVMDLVFRHQGRYYLLDWKSNDLGADYAAYSPENLKREMADHLYTLQYHLYVLALDRYLSLRLEDYDYERDFGGVAYVFLRGVNPQDAPGCGLFFEKPPVERIRELGQWMLADGLIRL